MNQMINQKMRFQDRVVLITGGARGIGRAAAIAFSREGARVAVNYRNNMKAARACLDLLEGEGHLACQADLSDPSAIHEMVEQVIDHYGRIDVLVNNAGIHETHPIDKVDYKSWQKEWKDTIGVNLIGAANITYCVAQHMIRAQKGHIVFVSSRGAFRGEPDQPAYGASKAGMNQLAQSLAQKLAPYGIFSGVVAPGFVETDLARDILDGPRGPGIRSQSPFQRVAKPEEVAHAILFLAEEKSLFLSGAIIDVNGASYLRS